MDLKEILAISGYGGLFKYVSQGRNGIIVEGLEDKKRMNAFSHFKVSSLNDIAIFCDSGEVALREVFKKISEKENAGPIMGGKIEDKKVKDYFAEILPDYDKDKVYTSDMKKVLSWYNLLQKNGITSFEQETPETPATEEEKNEDAKA